MTEKEMLRKRDALEKKLNAAGRSHGALAYAEIGNETKSPELDELAREVTRCAYDLAEFDAAWKGGEVTRRLEQEKFAAENERRRKESGFAGVVDAANAGVALAVKFEETAALLGTLALAIAENHTKMSSAISLVRNLGEREQLSYERIVPRDAIEKLVSAVVDPRFHYSVHESVAIAGRASTTASRMVGMARRAFDIADESEAVSPNRRRARAPETDPFDLPGTNWVPGSVAVASAALG